MAATSRWRRSPRAIRRRRTRQSPRRDGGSWARRPGAAAAVEQDGGEAGASGTAPVVLGIVADAEDGIGGKAQVVADGAVEIRMRLAAADLGGDQGRLTPGGQSLQATEHTAEAGVEVRGDPQGEAQAIEGAERRAGIGVGTPGVGAAEVVPEFGERPLGIGDLGQASPRRSVASGGARWPRRWPAARAARRSRRSRRSVGSARGPALGSRCTPCRRAAAAYTSATEGAGSIKVPTASKTTPRTRFRRISSIMRRPRSR